MATMQTSSGVRALHVMDATGDGGIVVAAACSRGVHIYVPCSETAHVNAAANLGLLDELSALGISSEKKDLSEMT